MNDLAPPAAPAAPESAPVAPPPPSPTPAAAAFEPPAAQPSWRDTLAEDLRGNAVFANYQTLDDFAKGHIATKALASSKVPMPGDTAESFKAFADAVRPADAAAYQIDVPEGMSNEVAEGFRAVAHEVGLHPLQVKAIVDYNKVIVDYNNGLIASDLQAASDASAADLNGFKSDYAKAGGNFDQKLDAVKAWLPQMGVQMEAEDLAAIDSKLGSANLMRLIFSLHDRTGDIPALPGDVQVPGAMGALSPVQADARQKELFKDAGWRAKAQVKDSAEWKENERLTHLVAQGRMQQQRGQVR